MARKETNSELATKVGIGALGAAIGGAIALLFAPRSGKQTRAKVAQETKKLARATTKTVKQLEKQSGIVAAPARKVATKRVASKKK